MLFVYSVWLLYVCVYVSVCVGEGGPQSGPPSVLTQGTTSFIRLAQGAVGTIADVAVTKHNQRLDKILIYFYLHFIEELSKVVFMQYICETLHNHVCTTYVCCKRTRNAHFIQHTLVINACVSDRFFS